MGKQTEHNKNSPKTYGEITERAPEYGLTPLELSGN